MSEGKKIRKVGVIGAGVMGAGIAAQAANGGADVVLLDIVPAGASERSCIARAAIERFVRAGSSGGLMHPSVADRITTGNIEDDFALLGDCDWIVEVVVERLDIKQDLYRRIAEVRRADAIVSSNTSTIPLVRLVNGLPLEFRRHFVVTHYFNPPRHMRLVEVVSGEDTLPEVVERVSDFNDRSMGKTVIRCADRPGFIGNRLGVFWLQFALREAVAMGLTVEEADAVMRVCGFPSTGVFGLWDLCGIDLMPSVVSSLAGLLPPDDDFAAVAVIDATVEGMLARGYKGRKGSTLQGFYRQYKDPEGRRVREAIDLTTLEYRAPREAGLASTALKPGQLAELIASGDKGGQYAWRVLSQVLHYATKLIPDVAEEVEAFDQAMMLGYNWRWGPFEMIDRIGLPEFVARLHEGGAEVSEFLTRAAGRPIHRRSSCGDEALDATGEYRPVRRAEGTLRLGDVKRGSPVRGGNRSALWDLGDDVWCLELTGRVPALNLELLGEIRAALDAVIAANKALVFYTEEPVFAAGADLKQVLKIVDRPAEVEQFIRIGQELFVALKQAPVPVVGALCGKALAGGTELLLHCHAIQAHAESAMGLVEVQVGIVPAWGGCREMLVRSAESVGPERAIEHCFELIRGGKVSASALEARALGFLRDGDGITMNVDRVLFDAKRKAMALRVRARERSVPDRLPLPVGLSAGGENYQRELEAALLDLLARASEPGWYERFLDLERASDMALFARPEAQARIRHLMENGKPLSN